MLFQMLRIPPQLNNTARKKVASLWSKSGSRSQSTQTGSGGGKGLQVAILTGTVAVAGVGGVVGYAASSNGNRKVVENTLPGSNYILESILGPLVDIPPAPPRDLPNIGLINKKLEGERKQQEEERQQKLAKAKELAALQAKEAKEAKSKPIVPPPSAVPAPPIEQIKEDVKPSISESKDGSKNDILSKKIEESVILAKKHVSDALTAAEEAAKVVRSHAEKAYEAIDSEDGHERLYAAAAEMAKLKSEMIKVAEEKVNMATKCLGQLEKAVTSGKEDNSTKSNPIIASAEDALSELSFVISRINNVVAEALQDSSVVHEFKEMLEAGREQFEMEVRSLLPDAKLGEASDKLSSEELNLLLAHAHRKVLGLQKSLARQQTVDKERSKDNRGDSGSIDGNMQADLDRQRHELTNDHRHRLNQLREDLETEMRTQLKRQAAAHSDHLADVLEVQQKDLETKFEREQHDAVQSVKDANCKSLSIVKGEIDGLKCAVKARSDVDKSAYAAHELWLACESLRTALRLGKENAMSWQDQLVPLEKQIQVIRDAAGSEDHFVETVLNSLPSESLKRGVYTEEALRERFIKVERICKRVALVGNNGGSLVRYFFSYLQSIFVVSAFDSLPGKELRDEQIDVDSLNTFDILSRARYCLNKDDLIMALRYMTLLTGEADNVAEDWRREVRLTLEALQAAEAVRAHAATQGARAL